MVQSILPEKVESGRGANPPLGLLYIVAGLKHAARDQIEFIDAQAEPQSHPSIESRIIAIKPDVVGITALSFTMPDVLEVCAAAKRHGAITVVGGPHAHIFPEETARLENVDYILRGEGERSFIELVDCIREKLSPLNVPGAVWRDEMNIRKGPDPVYIDDLDALDHPARDITDVGRYNSVLSLTSPVTTVMTSRGCPYRCIFCDRPHLGRKFRYRSAESVADEIAQCLRLGIREFLFYDDNFATNRERAEAIAEEILKRGLKVIIDARLRVTDLDDKLAVLLRRAGVDRMHLGVESGDPLILEKLRKGITIDDARRAFKSANRAGIRTLAYFLIGAPGETRETIRRTIKLAKSLKPDYTHFSLLMPFPGTELYFKGLSMGLWKGDPWREFAIAPRSDFVPPVWDENLSRKELIELTLGAYREFYRDPRYLLRRLRKIRSASEALRQIRAGMKILRL